MPSSRSRDRHLAKNAERRRLAREQKRQNRRTALGVGGAVAVILIAVLAIGLLTRPKQDDASASPSTSVSDSNLPQQTGTVTAQAKPPAKVACGGTRPAAADKPKPQFDAAPTADAVLNLRKTYVATVETSCGTIEIELDTQHTPATVASFVFLAEQRYFDGTFITRVVDSIDVVQGGDPTGTGGGGPGYSIPDELSGKEHYAPGTVAMANGGPGTGGSQFFLITGPDGPNLDANPAYTIFGHITEGLDVAQEINALMKTHDGSYDGPPTEAVYIDSVKISSKPTPSPTPSASG